MPVSLPGAVLTVGLLHTTAPSLAVGQSLSGRRWWPAPTAARGSPRTTPARAWARSTWKWRSPPSP